MVNEMLANRKKSKNHIKHYSKGNKIFAFLSLLYKLGNTFSDKNGMRGNEHKKKHAVKGQFQ